MGPYKETAIPMTEALTTGPKTCLWGLERDECSGYCSDYLLRWARMELHLRDMNFNVCSCMQREPKSCNSARNNSGAIGREFESLRAHQSSVFALAKISHES